MEIWKSLALLLVILLVLLGNATTATKLATARTISLAGAVEGSASFDGSKNVSISTTQKNITTTTGTLTISSGDSSLGTGRVSYPSGFNKDNCIIIALAVLINGYYQYYNTSNGNTLTATLYSNGISLFMRNYSSLATGNYTAKIVLMKIS